MINNEKAILNAKLNKSESEKNTGKKMDKKPSLLNKFIKGGITLAIAASLFACTTNSNTKVDENSYNYSPMIHNEYTELEDYELENLIENVDRLIVTDSRYNDETYYVESYEKDEYSSSSENMVIEGESFTEPEYTVSFPGNGRTEMIFYSGMAEIYRTEEIPLIGAGERKSIKKFLKHPELANTLKFNNIDDKVVAYLDLAALEKYVEYKTYEKTEDQVELPTPINTNLDEAYEIKKINSVYDNFYEREVPSYNIFEGFKIPEGYKYDDSYDAIDNEEDYTAKFYLDVKWSSMLVSASFIKGSNKYEKVLKLNVFPLDYSEEIYYNLKSDGTIEEVEELYPGGYNTKQRSYGLGSHYNYKLINEEEKTLIYDMSVLENKFDLNIRGLGTASPNIENTDELKENSKVKRR